MCLARSVVERATGRHTAGSSRHPRHALWRISARGEGGHMPRYIPSVHDYMTPVPIVAATHDDISGALAAMNEHEVGHLPVVREGVPVGIVSKRQLALASEHADGHVTIDQVMHHEPVVVNAATPLTKVAREMMTSGADAVIVMDGKAI